MFFKQKTINKISLLLRSAALIMLLLTEFFGFGILPKAKADCGYNVTFTGNKSTASVNETNLVFNVKIVSAGVQKDCDANLHLYFGYVMKSGKIYSLENEAIITFQGNTLTKIYNVNLKTLYPQAQTNLSNPGQIVFRLAVLSPKNITVPDKYFTVNITGGGAGGDFDVRVLPLKDSYKDTDQGIKVQITTDPDKFEIGSAIKQVYVNIYSDSNYSNSLITDTVDTSKIYRPGMTTVNQWPIQISSNKGLGNGSHTIYVDLWQAGTQSRIGQGKVVIQVSGSGGGLKNNGIACNDSSECKSNYCDYDTGKCQSCADYEEGVCEAGFTCNSSGVCVTSSSAGGKQPGETAPPVVAFDCTRAGADKDPNYSKYCLENPLPVDSLTDMILLIMRGFLAIVGIWAVVFIIIGGFKMVMAQGNEEAFTSAKKTVTWAIIGLGIALLAFSVIAIVQNFFNISFPANPTSWLRGYKWFI